MMIHAQPRRGATTRQDHVFVRALSSITPQQAVTIVQAVQAIHDQGWIVQISDDYDGYRSLLIEAQAGNDTDRSYFVSGTAQRLDMFEASEDHLTPIGCFSHVDDLTAKLLSLLTGS